MTQTLDTRLTRYQTQGDRPEAQPKPLHWSVYAAAAGSALAMTSQAEAQIIYSGANQNVSVDRLASTIASAPPVIVDRRRLPDRPTLAELQWCGRTRL